MPEQQQFYDSYDVGATSYVYGRLTGPHQGAGGVTAATSTTVTADAGTANSPFAGLKVGDRIWFRTAETTVVKRTIATFTSPTSIVVSGAALTFSAIPWHYMPFTVGAGVTYGWHRIAEAVRKTVHVQLGTVAAAGGVDISIELRGGINFAADPIQVYTKNYAAATAYEDSIVVTEVGSFLRVGVKGGSGFAGTDDITIFLETLTK